MQNNLGVLGVSFQDIWYAYKSYGRDGLKNVFSSVITSADIDMLKEYNALLSQGATMEDAMENALLGASKAARKLAIDADGTEVNLDNLGKGAGKLTRKLIGTKVATIALNAALTMGLSFAIQKVCEGIDYLVHLQEKQFEKAQEQAASAKEAADAAREEYEQLDELIERYKELAQSETQDSSTREEIKSIQEEITDLVGAQASNLDLVNGKLDEELQKLHEIQNVGDDSSLDQMVSTARRSYGAAKNAVDKYDTKDANFAGDIGAAIADWMQSEQTITIDYWGGN